MTPYRITYVVPEDQPESNYYDHKNWGRKPTIGTTSSIVKLADSEEALRSWFNREYNARIVKISQLSSS